MAGYWSSSVLLFQVMNQDEVEVHKNSKKKTQGFIIWPKVETLLVIEGLPTMRPKDCTKQFGFCGNKAGKIGPFCPLGEPAK